MEGPSNPWKSPRHKSESLLQLNIETNKIDSTTAQLSLRVYIWEPSPQVRTTSIEHSLWTSMLENDLMPCGGTWGCLLWSNCRLLREWGKHGLLKAFVFPDAMMDCNHLAMTSWVLRYSQFLHRFGIHWSIDQLWCKVVPNCLRLEPLWHPRQKSNIPWGLPNAPNLICLPDSHQLGKDLHGISRWYIT